MMQGHTGVLVEIFLKTEGKLKALCGGNWGEDLFLIGTVQ